MAGRNPTRLDVAESCFWADFVPLGVRGATLLAAFTVEASDETSAWQLSLLTAEYLAAGGVKTAGALDPYPDLNSASLKDCRLLQDFVLSCWMRDVTKPAGRPRRDGDEDGVVCKLFLLKVRGCILKYCTGVLQAAVVC